MNPKLPVIPLAQHFPDPRYPTLPDITARNRFFQSALSLQHTTLSVNDTQTQTATELQRVKLVQVGTVSGGTVTVQLQVEGRDLFDDTVRPVSGAAVREPTNVYTFPAGSVLSTIIEATSGSPTGTANVVIETEPYILSPQLETVKLKGKARLRVSKRREAVLANAGTSFIGVSPTTGIQAEQRNDLGRDQANALITGSPSIAFRPIQRGDPITPPRGRVRPP